MDTGKPKLFRPIVSQLEARDVPAIASIDTIGTVLVIRTDNVDSVVQVTSNGSTISVLDGSNGQTRTFARPLYNRVDVFGGSGNDFLKSTGKANLTVRLIGRGGNDVLEGGPDRNVIIGGDGNDIIFGRGGNDLVGGGAGDDFIFGGIGNDVLEGDEGDDTIIGGPGIDGISGGAGDDVLVSIDGSNFDTVDAGSGNDILWLDLLNGVRESATGLDANDLIHAVDQFANGANLTLDGDRIPDPALDVIDRPNDVYEAFYGRPLFPDAGPALNDIEQNLSPGSIENAVLNDGWFLASMGATIQDFPEFLRRNMVDFADGTYGFDFNGTFIRVDNDLPVSQFGSLLPSYAKFGPDNSMWVPILEKMIATAADPLNPSYQAINGGIPPSVAFQLFGATVNTLLLPTGFLDTFQLSDILSQERAAGHPIVLSVFVPPVGVPLVAGQSYTLTRLFFDNFGDVSRIEFRTPTGSDGTVVTDLIPDDGYVTISLADLFATDGQLDIAS